MSGHSKWANIKHRKAAQDAKRGNLFQKLVRTIIVAAKEGGGDPAMNMRLKTAIEKAKAVSVPADNITKAIKRGTGEIEGVSYEEITYEAYGPSGTALLIDIMTDNRNRTAPEIRALLSRNSGTPGEPGSVGWMFERKGVIQVKGKELDEDSLMTCGLDAGMDDLVRSSDGFTLYCDSSALNDLAAALKQNGYLVENADVEMVAKTTINLDNLESAQKVLKLVDVLEEHDDVQNVWSNFDISDEIMEKIE
ncbi:MAG: YebC/PmpR family DNA-binding transcriptional regulator [Synergistaceae bacterium]|nr:YebC/PmpR family DNA-binding transcriptional regulator [Synergistaceae bacterium]